MGVYDVDVKTNDFSIDVLKTMICLIKQMEDLDFILGMKNVRIT